MYLRPGFVVVIVGATLTSLSTIIVAARYYCRHFLMGSMGVSDHLMLAALIVSWGNLVINYYQDVMSSQYRPSYFRIPEKQPEIAVTVRGTLITWWVYRISYIIALCFVKLSILFFYRTIATQRTFRRLVYTTIGFVSLYTFGACLAAIFQCETPSDAWNTAGYFAQFDRNPNTKKPNLKCYDPIRLWVFCAAANLLSDVVILLLPIPALLSLRVPMTKRLALIGIFSIGIMAIIASSVRMWVMMLWAESPANSARFGADLLLWGQVETNSGIVSASIPFLRLLFRRREKEERGVTQRKIEASPPKPMEAAGVSQNKPLEIDTWAFFGDEKKDGQGSPNWGPFITVPESLSSGSRGSTLLEPTHPHGTV
ncbi:Nn.00g023590.m01.CDS01 [Neocucurbitaria sp. VM-36]